MNFLKRYKHYILENLDHGKSVLQRKLDAFEKLKSLMSKNLGYFGKFSEYLLEENVPYEELEKAYKDLLELKSKSKNLDISELKYEKLIDKIQETKEDLIAKDLVNQFPSEQRNLLKDLSDSDKKSFRRLALMISQKENLKNFISKISRYKNYDDLERSMIVFSKSKDNSRETVNELLSDSKSSIVFDKKNILVIKIPTHEEIKKFGSDTSWCIVSSNYTWDRYMKGGNMQFVLYNYNKEDHDSEFKIGFTLTKYGDLEYAHDILDASCKDELIEIFKNLDLKFADLIPKLKPIDISNLKRNSKNEDLMIIYKSCRIEEIPQVIQSLLTWSNKSESFRAQSIRILLGRYFNEKEFVFESDLKSIDKTRTSDLLTYVLRANISIDGKFINANRASSLKPEALKKGIEIWDDKNMIVAVKGIASEFQDHFEKYGSDVMKLISDRLNKMYRDGKIKPYNKEKTHYIYSIELFMLITNYKLGRGKQTPNHDKIISEMPNHTKDDYAHLLDLDLDLNNYTSAVDSPDKVIKKDYPDAKITIYSSSIDNLCFLVDHLDGYTLNLKISKNTIKDILNPRHRYISRDQKVYPNQENNKLIKLLDQLSGKKKWSKVSDGKLSVEIDS